MYASKFAEVGVTLEGINGGFAYIRADVQEHLLQTMPVLAQYLQEYGILIAVAAQNEIFHVLASRQFYLPLLLQIQRLAPCLQGGTLLYLAFYGETSEQALLAIHDVVQGVLGAAANNTAAVPLARTVTLAAVAASAVAAAILNDPPAPPAVQRAVHHRVVNRDTHRFRTAGIQNARNSFRQHAGVSQEQPHVLGGPRVPCEHCQALHWPEECLTHSTAQHFGFGGCCSGGKVQLQPLETLPQPLHSLINGTHHKSGHFLKNIRKYNCAFQLASTSAQVDETLTGGVYNFTINGSVHHRMGPLEPAPGEPPIFAQLYILDPDPQLQRRQGVVGDLDREIVAILQSMLHDHNPYVQSIRHAHEMGAQGVGQVKVIIRPSSTPDPRRYNTPTSVEVAGFVPDGLQPQTNTRDVVINLRGGPVCHITDLSPAYDPLHFVLLFPRGENGWQNNIPLAIRDGGTSRRGRGGAGRGGGRVGGRGGAGRGAIATHAPHEPIPGHEDDLIDLGQDEASTREVTARQFAAYRLQQRTNEPTHLFLSGRLFQEYMVDQY
eukprot:gene11276-18908_t